MTDPHVEERDGTARSIALRSVIDVCAFVDELPESATGEIMFEDEGSVFVEEGRVCWAAARGLSRRLGDLLAESAKLDRPSMDALYQQCKSSRTPLGEHLVRTAVVSADALRTALLRHTVESLVVLASSECDAQFSARFGSSYAPQFCFATSELVVRALERETDERATLGREELVRSMGEGDFGAVFTRRGTRATPEPIAISGIFSRKTKSLVRLGRWASSAIDVACALGAESPLVVARREDRSFVAWPFAGACCAVETSALGAARLLNRRAQRRERAGGFV